MFTHVLCNEFHFVLLPNIFLIPGVWQNKQVAYHTPPQFPIDVIETIREGASLLFQQLGLRDFARIDGWFLPDSFHMLSSAENRFGKTELGTVVFTDINLVRLVFDYTFMTFFFLSFFFS